MPPGLTKEFENSGEQMKEETFNDGDLFSGFKEHFLSFKRDKYLANTERFQKLADTRASKFTVIACAAFRVYPSNILGFQPGDAFMVRNVANLVPPFEDGPSETKAALEFSVNTLQVVNILVIGHSRCGGICALMIMPEEEDDSRLQLCLRASLEVGLLLVRMQGSLPNLWPPTSVLTNNANTVRRNQSIARLLTCFHILGSRI